MGVIAPSIIPTDQIEGIPALRRIASKGAQLLDLGTEHGLRGVFARKGDTFQVFYFTPDGQAVIGGVRGIAAEYVPVYGRARFAVGRIQFLQKLLKQPRLFHSDMFHRRHDQTARDNIQRALTGLRQSAPL